MFPFDQHPNFAYEIVSNSPGTAGTAIVIGTSSYAQFPDPGTSSAYNAVVWPGGTIPLASNAEIVRVVGKATAGTLYVTRNQESSSNRDIASSDQFAVAVTGKSMTDLQNIHQDGWTPAGVTWTYASATSFTIAGVDLTAKYSKGTRIKLTQSTGGTKYFFVTSSSFSTNTTVNITAGTTHTLNNEAITDPYYSYQVNPQGYPNQFAYTTTLGGVSSSNDVSMNFSCVGRIIHIHGFAQLSGVSNATTFTFTVPVAPNATIYNLAPTFVMDNSANVAAAGHIQCTSGSGTINIFKSFYGGAFTASNTKNAYLSHFSYPF